MHKLSRSGLIAAFLIQAASQSVAPVVQTPRPDVSTFLTQQLAFSPSDLQALEKGAVLVKLPKTPATREVAAFTIARVDVSADFLVERMRDIVTFKKNPHVLQIGKFSTPPRLEDLDGLTLDQGDIDAIKHCRIKSCDLKMSAAAIEKFQKVNWAAPDHRDHVTGLMRKMLLEHVQAYLKGGNSALGKYEDKSYALDIAEEGRALLKPAFYMYAYSPELQQYLEGFPNGNRSTASSLEGFTYWSKEEMGLKPVISMTHVAIFRQSPEASSEVIFASKGIYASHYLEGSLGLTALVQQSQVSGAPRSYLIYANRSRTDALRGLFAGLRRSLVGGRLRDAAKKNMATIKQRLEADYQSSRSQAHTSSTR